MNQLIYINNHEWNLFRRTIGQLPQKKGKGKLPLFCGNVERLIPIYDPDSALKEKNVSIFYHQCREAVASWVARIAKEGTATNLADLFTKMLVQTRRETLLDKFTYWFIREVVLFEWQGSGFLPKKGLPLPPYQGLAHKVWFFCTVQIDSAMHQHSASQ